MIYPKAFEDWWSNWAEDVDTPYKNMAYQSWRAGRDSMRDDAIDKLGDYEALKCAQIVAGIGV